MTKKRILLPIFIIAAVLAMNVVVIGMKSNNERDQYRSSPELTECSVTIPTVAVSISSSGLETAGLEDYRDPAGVMENDTLRITLEARPAEWRPWGPDGPAIYTHVFAADGEPPRIPGPLIRFTAGTPLQVTVRNTLPDTLAVRGLRDKARGGGLPGIIADQLIVPPSGEESLIFTSTLAGTYSFGAGRLSVSTEPDTPLPGFTEADRGFRGVMIVDEPGEIIYPEERFFLLTHWADLDYPATFLPATRFFINGRSWPHTERLTYAQEDTIRWRVINFTGRNHPMHLHGFYFSVDAKGDLNADYAFVFQNGDEPPAPDSLTFPGSPLILTRGEPTQINVHNQADVPLGVHWHGLELESWADGVPGWSGMPGSVIPAVQPGSSFSVRMTPPRSGTFMYHVHSEPGHQLAQGLYGPFLVMEPDEEYNPESDRYFILGSLGSGDDPPAAVNGELEPGLMELRTGETYRLRFMHISPDDDKKVSLLKDGEPVKWQYIAKDGADLLPNQIRTIPAELDIHVGETYDFLWTPEESGSYTLSILTTFDRGAPAFPREAPEPHRTVIELRVNE